MKMCLCVWQGLPGNDLHDTWWKRLIFAVLFFLEVPPSFLFLLWKKSFLLQRFSVLVLVALCSCYFCVSWNLVTLPTSCYELEIKCNRSFPPGLSQLRLAWKTFGIIDQSAEIWPLQKFNLCCVATCCCRGRVSHELCFIDMIRVVMVLVVSHTIDSWHYFRF